jgi:flagellum-specific ATP synthase
VDEAIALNGPIERFLGQGKEEATRIGEGYSQLASILGVSET